MSANLKYSRAKSPNTSWQTLTDYTDKVKPYTQLVDENGNLTNIRTVSLALQNTFDKVSGLKDVTYNPINDAYQDYNTTQNFGARLNAYMHLIFGMELVQILVELGLVLILLISQFLKLIVMICV